MIGTLLTFFAVGLVTLLVAGIVLSIIGVSLRRPGPVRTTFMAPVASRRDARTSLGGPKQGSSKTRASAESKR